MGDPQQEYDAAQQEYDAALAAYHAATARLREAKRIFGPMEWMKIEARAREKLRLRREEKLEHRARVSHLAGRNP